MNLEQTSFEIKNYTTIFEEEQAFRLKIIAFLAQNPAFYQRTTLSGHVTGSAWIVSADFKKALLIHHKKLNIWIQPGGHADDTDESLLHTAAREAAEECGVAVAALQNQIFDVDVHFIPQKNEVPGHFHYDFRYIFVADEKAKKTIDTTEINDAQWVDIESLIHENTAQSIRRMAIKTKQLQD